MPHDLPPTARGLLVNGPALFVLIGPAGSGKSTWLASQFSNDSVGVLSSDIIREMVGESDTDRTATDDMFAVLMLALSARLNRRLSTAIDSTALEPERRLAYIAAARRNNMTTVAVVFRTTAATCLKQNSARQRQVPDQIIRAHVEQTAALRPSDLLAEGFDYVFDVGLVN